MTNFSHLFRLFHIILQFHKKLLECFSTFIFLQVGTLQVIIMSIYKYTTNVHFFKYLPRTHMILTYSPLQVSTPSFHVIQCVMHASCHTVNNIQTTYILLRKYSPTFWLVGRSASERVSTKFELPTFDANYQLIYNFVPQKCS